MKRKTKKRLTIKKSKKIKKQKAGSNGKKILISYTDKGFEKAKKRLKDSALNIAKIDEVIQYTPADIDEEFKKKYNHLLSLKKGAGYYLWKPYVIKKALNKMNDNDILIYCDTAMEFTSSVDPYISKLEKSFMLFQFPDCFWVRENEYTKMDIFKYFNCKDNPAVIDTAQLDASHSIWKKNKNSLDFVSKWLEICGHEKLITDDPSIEPNFGQFRENRYDQSVLSCLAKLNKDKYNIQIENVATQCGDCARNETSLPTIINHHRERE